MLNILKLQSGVRLAWRTPFFSTILREVHDRKVNYYDVLGVGKYADVTEIKMAYFKMAKRFHPDTNKTVDAKQMFELVAEAYAVLSDENLKANYDETGEAYERYGGRSEGPGRQSTDSSYTPEQMYSRIFNCDQTHTSDSEIPRETFSANESGEDISRDYVVNLSLEEAITGTMICLYIRVAGVCNKCDGSRAEMGYTGKSCPYCEGTGFETIKTGHIVGRKECSYCNGEKIFYKFKCIECEGIGRTLYSRPFYINIPPGSEHGQLLKFEIDWEILEIPEDEDEKKREIYVTLNVKDSNVFRRDGMDLYSHLRLTPALALLGGNVEYEGLTRSCDLDIRSGTSSHTTLVIDQAGVHTEFYKGDHHLTAVVKVPKELSWRQRRLLMRFAMLDTQETGAVTGIGGELDHKYVVNVQEPDYISNVICKTSLLNEEEPTLYHKLKLRLDEFIKKMPLVNQAL